jgi:hypothetical protein
MNRIALTHLSLSKADIMKLLLSHSKIVFGSALILLVSNCGNPSSSKQGGSLEIEAVQDAKTGQLVIREGGKAVLQYNYQTIEPGELLSQVAEPNLKYARPRSNYIHPLYGFDGEELTLDWPIDHPHHRAIYWAWPEVKLGEEMGDLHALQRVFARPSGNYSLRQTEEYAEIEAENTWLWEDQDPIMQETALMRAFKTQNNERIIDLEFHWLALKDSISVARRSTNLYGGLNVRLNSVENQTIEFHTDSETSSPRMAWAQLSGIFKGGSAETGVSILQHRDNPDYPGDWVEYPELNWFQPTFPAADTRYPIPKDEKLVLRYRIWIHKGKSDAESHAEKWRAFQDSPRLKSMD